MSPILRWRLATPLILLSGLCLAAVIIGAISFWDDDTGTERALTVFLGIMFSINLAISISIGADHRIQETPWLRIATWALFIALGCGVTLVRRQL